MDENNSPGNLQGGVSPSEAMAALAAFELNLRSGLMPTTGGAVSLMPRPQVDMMYYRNQVTVAKFVPIVPDKGGSPAVGRREWYVAAIEQALLIGDQPFRPDSAEEMNELLSEYRGSGVDWKRVHSYAADRDTTVPVWGNGSYWSSDSEPLSILAFCGEEVRVRVGQITVENRAANAGDLATSALWAERLAAVEKQYRKVWRVAVMTLVSVAALLALAFGTAHHWTMVDVPEEVETFHSEDYATGRYYVLDDGVSPCHVGQDWSDCTNLHVEEYNSACTGRSPLTTPYVADACKTHSAEIDRMKGMGGPGYTVSEVGGLGRLTEDPEIRTREVSNNDFRPAVTHDAVCYLWFMGECE